MAFLTLIGGIVIAGLIVIGTYAVAKHLTAQPKGTKRK